MWTDAAKVGAVGADHKVTYFCGADEDTQSLVLMKCYDLNKNQQVSALSYLSAEYRLALQPSRSLLQSSLYSHRITITTATGIASRASVYV